MNGDPLFRLAGDDEQLEPLGRLELLALQMAVDAFDRLRELALVIGFHEAADRDLARSGISMARREQGRDTLCFRQSGQFYAGLLLPQADVAEHEMHLFPLQNRKGLVEIVDGRNDLVPGVAEVLARAGIASRREVERMIAEGRVSLNGEKLTTPATLLEDLQGVTVDGRAVRPAAATRLFRFYKPQGTLTVSSDPKGRATIYDRLPAGLPRLMPVGRLDYMTEGLLLLNNDGELKRQLELPR